MSVVDIHASVVKGSEHRFFVSGVICQGSEMIAVNGYHFFHQSLNIEECLVLRFGVENIKYVVEGGIQIQIVRDNLWELKRNGLYFLGGKERFFLWKVLFDCGSGFRKLCVKSLKRCRLFRYLLNLFHVLNILCFFDILF